MLTLRFVAAIGAIGLIVLEPSTVCGQEYPIKPIRIVTSGIGGSADFIARLIAPGISGPLGQSVIIDNRGGIIPGQVVSKAPPDGYTLLVGSNSFWIGPLLQNASYDGVRDFSPITMVASSFNLVVVHPSLPVKSIKEFIALAKARPGELNYSFGSFGGSSHIAAELFKAMAGVKIQGVSYKVDSQGVNDLLAGEIQMSFESELKVGMHVASGKLRALAITSAKPSALAPGLPTVAATLPGFESVGVQGVFAPANTPSTIINRLNNEIVRFLTRPDVKKNILNVGYEAVGSSPEHLGSAIKSEIAQTAKLIKDAGIKAQ